MNHNVRKNSLPNQMDSRLNDLLLEVSCQRERIAVDELRKKRIIAQVLQRHSITVENEPSSKKNDRDVTGNGSKTLKLSIAAGIVFAALALLYTVFMEKESQTTPQNKLRSMAPPQQAVEAGDPRGQNDAGETDTNVQLVSLANVSRIYFPGGIEMAIGPNTQYIGAPNQRKSVTVQLSNGTLWISKDPQLKSVPLAVATPHGEVQVVGTSLSVHVARDTTIVKVFDGVVHFVDTAKTVLLLNAGNMLTTTSQVTQTEPIPNLSVEKAQFVKLGLQVIHSRKKTERTTQVGANNGISKRAEAKYNQRYPAGGASSTNVLSLNDLYTEIQSNRNQKKWQAAVDGYHQLIAQYGDTGKSQAAKVAVANLYLDQLQQPNLALEWYDRYLKGGSKSLLPEALLGKSRALRALNQPDAEKQVLKQIVQAYPESLYGVQAAQRLTQLRK